MCYFLDFFSIVYFIWAEHEAKTSMVTISKGEIRINHGDFAINEGVPYYSNNLIHSQTPTPIWRGPFVDHSSIPISPYTGFIHCIWLWFLDILLLVLLDLLMVFHFKSPSSGTCLSRPHLGSPAKVTKGARSLTLRYCPLQERKAYCVSCARRTRRTCITTTKSVHTVDGRNPAPPWMIETL